MTTTLAEQIAWQRQAVRVLSSLLTRAYNEDLPVLSWTIGNAGVSLTGHSYDPSPARRGVITAWAQALGITLNEHRRPGVITLTGAAEHLDTPQGWCTVALTCDIWDEEDTGHAPGMVPPEVLGD